MPHYGCARGLDRTEKCADAGANLAATQIGVLYMALEAVLTMWACE